MCSRCNPEHVRSRRPSVLVALAVLPAIGTACGGADFEWRAASPESQGLDEHALQGWARSVQGRGTEALLVVHNDRLVHEWYKPERSPGDRHYTASAAKGIFGGLGLALLLDQGHLRLDDRVASDIPTWRGEPHKSRVTIRHLVTHASGLENSEEGGRPHDELTGWKGAFWDRDPGHTPVHVSLNDVPFLFAPGEAYSYSNPGFAVLSYVLAARLREAGDAGLRRFLRRRVYRPIGIRDGEWSMGYGTPFEIDGLRVWATWGGGSIVPRAMARLGRLLLGRGDWAGERLLDWEAMESVVRYGGTPTPNPLEREHHPAPAAGWYTNELGAWPRVPRDAFAAAGAEHQLLLMIPSLHLIVVRFGGRRLDAEGATGGFWQALHDHLIDPLMEVFPTPPVPWSRHLSGAWFEPASSVSCQAEGSDNWPITWGTDGDLYAAYGDGRGFAPGTDRKLSLGFARIEGEADSFTGRNIRSPRGERTGDGPTGPKASGLLDVGGTLYMWVRNLDNARLAWSEDRGRTWQWGFRFEESFGSPTFLQFGPGYQGARDTYIYVYSQDGPTAYASNDRLVLARVHRDSIRDRDAYEFFAGWSEGDSPRWSRALSERAGVFRQENGVRRSEVVYNAWMDRYLLALGFDGATPELMGTGTEGAWGLFDAPEPWGPWTTVYFTPRWDIADTHSYRLPAKWIQDGGRTVHLVFSGRPFEGTNYDAFCVRRFRLLPTPGSGRGELPLESAVSGG